MDQARKLVRDLVDAEAPGPARARAEAGPGLAADLDKVLRLATSPKETRPEARRDAPAGGRDWSAALDLVRQAACVVRESQSHIEAVETRTREMAQRARDEIRAVEARAQAAEARAQTAEGRARDAEEWLRRLTDALHEEFGPERAEVIDLA